MTDAAGGTDSGQSSNMTALIEAIDARARQAGSDGAATLLRGMIGSVSEVLGSIQDRLDHVEDLLAPRAETDSGLSEQISASLQTFNARLGRLEEAFVQAVEDSDNGTDAVVDQVRAAVASVLRDVPPPAPDLVARDGLARVEASIARLINNDPSRTISIALDAVAERMTALEDRVRLAAQEQREPVADSVPLLDLVLQRLAAIEERVSKEPEPVPLPPPAEPPEPPDLRTPLEEALTPIRVKLTGLEQLIRTRGEDRPDQAAALRAALAPVADRLDGVELAMRESGNVSDERARRMDATIAALPGRISALEATLVKAAADAARQAPSGFDPQVFNRLEVVFYNV
jgi:hypothetical protein